MRRILKLTYAAIVGMMALGLGACTNDYEYDAATAEGQQVYFSNAMSSTVELSSSESSFSVPICRVKTDEALTVNLSLTDESGLFSAPSSVSFAAGESQTTVAISYDPSKFDYDDYKSATLAIADADYTTPYGLSAYTFSAGIPAPWESLGTGTIYDYFFDIDGETFDVEIQRNLLDPNTFRVLNPYAESGEKLAEEGYTIGDDMSDYLVFRILQPGETLAGVTITQPDLVYFEPTCSGVDVGYGMSVTLYHPSEFSSLNDESYWLYNYVADWQSDGTTPGVVRLAPYYYMSGIGGWNYTQENRCVQIVFPGYELSDYSVALEYEGAFIDTAGQSYAMANATLGSDVEETKLAVFEGDDDDAALNAILDGSAETTTITESGSVKLPCDYSGTCMVMAVTYAGGEPMMYNYVTFEFGNTASGAKARKVVAKGSSRLVKNAKTHSWCSLKQLPKAAKPKLFK